MISLLEISAEPLHVTEGQKEEWLFPALTGSYQQDYVRTIREKHLVYLTLSGFCPPIFTPLILYS